MKLKNKLRLAWQWISGESLMIWQWVKNIYFTFFSPNSRIRIFEGYGHYYLAKKYADKRTKISMRNKVAGGKRHYVIPVGDYSLAVINRSEIVTLKARRIFSKNLNILKLLENAYYISK